jgi:spore coat protein CotH
MTTQRQITIAAALLVLASCEHVGSGTGGPADYEAAFITDRIVTWNVTVEDTDWSALLVDPETYVPADVEVDGETYRRVGVRLMGDELATKKSLRIRFNRFDDGQEFHGLKRINLRNMAGDPTLVREALAYRLMRDAGVPASRTSFVWVCINDGPCGLHTQVEQVDKKFMEDRFDGDDAGNIYKVERGGTLIYRGDDPADYPELHVYEKKTNLAENDYSDLIGLMRVLDDTDGLETQLPAVLDVDGFLTALAVNTWMSGMNSYQGTSDNMYLYRDSDGIFHTIPWDMNQAFGNYHADPSDTCYMTTDQMIELDPEMPVCDPGWRPLVEHVLAVPSFMSTYRSTLRSLMAGGGTLEASGVIEDMNAMKTFIQDRVTDDGLLFPFGPGIFDDSFTTDIPDDPEDPDRIPGLRPFIEARDAYLAGVLGG